MKYSIPEISWHNRDPVLSADFQPRGPDVSASEPRRLATVGTDSHVLIWHLDIADTGAVSLEVAADLTRHQKAVNVARWSPSGEYLATGDDEAIIFVWKQRTDKDPPPIFDQTEEQDKETWIVHKTLRGHMEDVLDISWDINSSRLISGSVDNKLIVWDVAKARSVSVLSDHKGFVQGVAWDPNDQYFASMSTDRVFRIFDVTTKKIVSRSSKATLPVPPSHSLHGLSVRLYYDDTLQTYYRRLQFSPDGMMIAVPSGHIEVENGSLKPINAVFIYTRYCLKTPACVLPCGDSTALVVRWSPVLYESRTEGPKPAFPLPHRMVLAVATKTAVLLYDTQQKTPFTVISNIHYTRLTDLTWSSDGLILVASSTDGFCSVISFAENELGKKLERKLELPLSKKQEDSKEVTCALVEKTNSIAANEAIESKKPCTDVEKPQKKNSTTPKQKKSSTSKQKNSKTPENENCKTPQTPKMAKKIEIKGNMKLQAFMQFKKPENSEKPKTDSPVAISGPTTIDFIDDAAMAPWSDDSNSAIKPKMNPVTIELDDSSEDIKLVYEDSQNDIKSPDLRRSLSQEECSVAKKIKVDVKSTPSSPNVQVPANVMSPTTGEKPAVKTDQVTSSPKTPRRVSFVTLSSPKNPKKKS